MSYITDATFGEINRTEPTRADDVDAYCDFPCATRVAWKEAPCCRLACDCCQVDLLAKKISYAERTERATAAGAGRPGAPLAPGPDDDPGVDDLGDDEALGLPGDPVADGPVPDDPVHPPTVSAARIAASTAWIRCRLIKSRSSSSGMIATSVGK
jgi:hypothetical protein